MNDDELAYLAITRLQRAYADASTRKAWPEFAALITPDAQFSFDTRTGNVFEMVGADAFVEFGAKMTGRFSFYEYVPLNFVVEIGEDRETGEVSTFFGMYHDDYARVDGTWRFSRRHFFSLARRSGDDALQSFPLIDRPLN